jgi:hypothetical protein
MLEKILGAVWFAGSFVAMLVCMLAYFDVLIK